MDFDAMNTVAYLPQSKRLLDQVREVLRYKHYSLKTEQAYLYWVRFFVRWHGRNGLMQHPRDMGERRGGVRPGLSANLAPSLTTNTSP